MNALLNILAQRDGDVDYVKYLFGAVVFLIWVISSIMGAVAKRHEQEKRRRVREELEQSEALASRQGQSRRPVDLAPQVAMRVPRQVKPRQPARVAKRPIPPKQARRAVQHRVQPAVAVVEPVESIAVIAPVAPETAARPAPITASAAAVARWLKPATLQQQFILTEVLQPPVALREPRF
jgi:hypothetical protein